MQSALAGIGLCFSLLATSEPQHRAPELPCTPAWNEFAGTSGISSTIHSSVRGEDGLIYLGGRDGLYRITGGEVEEWTPDFTDNTALPSGKIKSLVNQGRYIWIGSNTGISRLDTATGIIERNDSVNASMGFTPVNALSIQGNALFVASAMGVHLVEFGGDISTANITQVYSHVGQIRDLHLNKGTVLAAGNKGLWRLHRDGQSEKLDLGTDDLRAIESIGAALWAISSDTLFKHDGSNDTWKAYQREALPGLPESRFTALSGDNRGRLWIGAESGISRWDLHESRPQVCRRSILGSDRDDDISIAHLSGQLGDYMFIGSMGRGASFASNSDAIRLIIPGGHYDSGLPANAIWSHAIDANGRFIAGTSKGVFIEEADRKGYFQQLAAAQTGHLRIYSLLALEPDQLWIGTSKGLFIYQGNHTDELSLLVDENGSPLAPAVFAIKVHQNKIFLATSMGLLVVEKDSRRLLGVFTTAETARPVTSAPQLSLPVRRVWSVDFKGDDIFVAGDDGVFRLSMAPQDIKASSITDALTALPPIGYVYNVTVAGEDELFIGTEAGLVRTDFDFSYYRKVTQINGRKLLAVMSSGKDPRGNLWIGVAQNGLFRYQPDSDQWHHLTQSQGLITNGVSQLGLSFSNRGVMSVSNRTGASVIDLNRLNLGDQMPLAIQLSSAEQGVLTNNRHYQTGPDIRNLTVQAKAKDLVEPGIYSLSYQLLQGDNIIRQATIPLGQDLAFLNLSPGTYHFSAVFKSTSGITSEPFTMSYDVIPHWWETLVFEVLIASILLAAVGAYFYYKTRSIEMRMDIIAEERKRIAQELHDTSLQDIFAAKMLGRSLVFELQEGDEKRKANKLMGLIDSAIVSVRDNVSHLSNLTNIPALPEAIEQLNNSVHLPDNAALVIEQTGTPWHVQNQRRFFLFRIIREATINAAKHAMAETIVVSLSWSSRHLIASVSDNGCGFDPEHCNTALTYGKSSMKCMAKAAKIKLDISSSPGHGTCVTARLNRFWWR